MCSPSLLCARRYEAARCCHCCCCFCCRRRPWYSIKSQTAKLITITPVNETTATNIQTSAHARPALLRRFLRTIASRTAERERESARFLRWKMLLVSTSCVEWCVDDSNEPTQRRTQSHRRILHKRRVFIHSIKQELIYGHLWRNKYRILDALFAGADI